MVNSPFLAVELTEHDVNRAQDGNKVGDLFAHAHHLQRGQVDEGWGAHVIAIGIGLAVRDNVVAEFTLGGFDTAVRLTGRDLDLVLRFDAHDRPGGDLLERLPEDLERLAHLVHADEVAGVACRLRCG